MKNIILLLVFSLSSALFSSVVYAAQDIVLDVRTPAEFQDSHVLSAKNIDFKNSNFKSEIEKLDKNKTYKLYCRSGHRAGLALKIMEDLGFKHVENLGGLSDAVKKLHAQCEGPKSC